MSTTLAAPTTQTHTVEYALLSGDSACETPASEREHFALSNARRWLSVLQKGLQHEPYCIRATLQGRTVGMLPLAFVKSMLFGRFLVSLPYINTAGVIADDPAVAAGLIDQAVQLAEQLDVRYLELRQEEEVSHSALTCANKSKVLMRLKLPATADELWTGFKAKLRSQVKSGQKHNFEVAWGGTELLDDFYAVFSHNMRDLGTPVFSPGLFASILKEFASQAELCVVRSPQQPIAAALLIHDDDRTEVPSASSLRAFNPTNVNMVMYWELLKRAVERGQQVFDFGRSSADSPTYRFKAQWGAQPHPSVWQYYLRRGSISDMRPDNSKFGLAIRVWRKLPVALTRMIGPTIVRGIP
jgi:FemAB-related protein (PEP-CTERM system-associated)